MFIEVSFVNAVNVTYGHLRPKDLNLLLKDLKLNSGSQSMTHLKVYITHIKPFLSVEPAASNEILMNELQQSNNASVQFVFPDQGNLICIEK
jgi:cAMP phosphodiesterase